MPRARNIKPAFFVNEDLAEIAPIGRLLFVALWTMADRAGRLEDRPKRIKAEALPYDDANADALLSELAERGFILRYARSGQRFIQVVNFTKHQNPHVREPESTIPAPDEHGASPVPAPDEHGASPVPAPDEHGTGPADSGFLIPDSPSLIPDGEVGDMPPKAREAGSRSPTGSRIPPDFPAESEIEFCRQERPDLDPRLLAAKFRDFWAGVPGVKGRKCDWPATWRNFVRSEFARAPPARASPTRADRLSATVAALTGRQPKTEIIDVTEAAAVRLG